MTTYNDYRLQQRIDGLTASGVTTDTLTTTSGDIVSQIPVMIDISSDILPNMTGASGVVSVYDIGSSSKKFQNLYVHDAFIDAGSLYINDKKVLEDISDTITITTDVDQDLALKTTGIGDINLLSSHSISASSKGGIELIIPADQTGKDLDISNSSNNGGVYFTAGGSNQSIEFLAFDNVGFTSETVTIDADVTITGSLTSQSLIVNGQSVTGDVTLQKLTTTSGDIVDQIPSLTGYATESWVSTNYSADGHNHTEGDISGLDKYTQAEVDTLITTTSGDVVSQIPSLTGYATETWVNTNFIDTAEMTTISGDLVAQMGTGSVTEEQLTTTSGDIVSQIPSLDGYATEAYVDANTGGGGGISSTSSGTAAETIPQYRVVYADATASGYLNLGEYDQTEAKANTFAIVTETGGLIEGQSGELTLFGKVTNPEWSWSPNTDLFLSTSGTLTQTQPTANSTYVVPCGHSLMEPTDIWFSPKTGWKLGASNISAAGPLVRGAVEGRFDRNFDTELIWTPVNGNGIGLWNGYEWRLVTPASNPTAANTATTLSGVSLAVDSLYDVFAEWDSDDNFNFVFKHWDGATAGASSRGYTLHQHQGVYVEADTADGRKRRWLGVVYMANDSGAKFKDEDTKRFISNYYNVKTERMEAIMTGNAWAYDSDTWRKANNDDSTKVEFVICYPRLLRLEARHNTYIVNVSSNAETGIAIDSTSAVHEDCNYISSGYNVGGLSPPIAVCITNIAEGYHYTYTIERSSIDAQSVNFSSYSKGYLCGEIII